MDAMTSAFKTQTEKRYGSVEKMYIHFYTIASGSDTLDIYWYCNDTENIELFSDLKYFLNKMKTYGEYTTYTGDVFVVKNLNRFKELLILVGTEDSATTSWTLQGDKVLSVNTCKVKKASKFYEIFDICFEDYEIINSFSSEASLSKNRIEMDEFITNTSTTSNNSTILVHFNEHKYPMPYYKFNQMYFSTVKSRVGDNILSNWFSAIIAKNEYLTAFNTIHKLIDYNEKEEDATTVIEEEEKDDATVMTEQEPAKISHDEWIKLFCDLYLDDSSKGSDLLLSDIYQMYLTASGWTQTNTVTMATFIKRLRSMNKFTIKRRAKGMMVIGVSCLVNQQSELFLKVKSGQSYNRQLSHYKSDVEINSILTKYNDEIEKIGLKYTRETFILLNDSNINLDYQTVAQFVSIPQISTQLKLYSEYIDSVLKDITETEINSKRVRKFNTEIQKPLEEFRELCTRCVLYFPFVNTKNSATKKLNFIYDLNSTATGPTAFNEHFGMFVSSKEYHLFEPEKGTPQEYNNSMGTPLDSITPTDNASTKNDFSIWKEGTRIVPNLDLRPSKV
jgi:hypothetical protein